MIKSETDKEQLKKALKNFTRDYYEGCTKYRIIIQFIEGPMKEIEIEVGLRGITFGDSKAEINVFGDTDLKTSSFAKIIYQNGHYFLMNSSDCPQLSFYKCKFKFIIRFRMRNATYNNPR